MRTTAEFANALNAQGVGEQIANRTFQLNLSKLNIQFELSGNVATDDTATDLAGKEFAKNYVGRGAVDRLGFTELLYLSCVMTRGVSSSTK